MRPDFWNHPIVVSSFRVRFRGRAPSAGAVTYFLALVALGAIQYHNLASMPDVSWVRIYFVTLISIEICVAALMAMSATGRSMRAEVVNRTLDYQRTALGPYEILIGKLIGEPAQGWLAVTAGFPLLVWCCAMGAVSGIVLLLLMVNLLTTAMMAGAMGLQQPLDSERARNSSRATGGVVVLLFLLTGPVVQMLIHTSALRTETGRAIVGLLTPVISIMGVARGEPFQYTFSLFGAELPYLVVTPIVQLAFTSLLIYSMARRLVTTLNPALSKVASYAVLLIVDLVAASLCLSEPAFSAAAPLASFALVHLMASLLLLPTVTPNRECLASWIWRFRGRRSMWQDLLWGERSENVGVLLTYAAIGVLTATTLVVWPLSMRQNLVDAADLHSIAIQILSLTALMLLALGSLYQWLASVNAAAAISCLGFATVITVVPHVAGAYLNEPLLQGASASAHFAGWFADLPQPPIWPVFAVYGSILLVSRYLFWQRLAGGIASINRTRSLILSTD